jgi:hypothetical protein
MVLFTLHHVAGPGLVRNASTDPTSPVPLQAPRRVSTLAESKVNPDSRYFGESENFH